MTTARMVQPSCLSPELVDAYEATAYLTPVTPVGAITLRPGDTCAELSALFAAESADAMLRAVVFITAYNPFSLRFPSYLNEERHRQLGDVIQAGQWTHFVGEGVGQEAGAWEPEKSYLVLGVHRRTAMDLGLLFQQNAIVYAEVGQPAELILLR